MFAGTTCARGARSRQGSPLRVAPLYRAIRRSLLHQSRAPCCPTSRAPHHGQCLLAGPVDAEEGAGVEIVLDRAVPSVAAALGPAVTGIACRTPSRSGRRWQAVAGRRRRWAARRWRGGTTWFCDHAATSSAVLLRSWVMPQLQFIDRVDVVRDGVPSCAFLCCAQRQVPTLLSFLPGCGCCSTLTRSSMSWERSCSMEACERISHFLRVARALRLESGRYFLSPLFWQPPAPVRCDSPRKLLDEFRLFST